MLPYQGARPQNRSATFTSTRKKYNDSKTDIGTDHAISAVSQVRLAQEAACQVDADDAEFHPAQMQTRSPLIEALIAKRNKLWADVDFRVTLDRNADLRLRVIGPEGR